jgi:hypothetical protein
MESKDIGEVKKQWLCHFRKWPARKPLGLLSKFRKMSGYEVINKANIQKRKNTNWMSSSRGRARSSNPGTGKWNQEKKRKKERQKRGEKRISTSQQQKL